MKTDLAIDVWPPMTHPTNKSEAFVEPCLCFPVKAVILDKVMLKIYCSNNCHTVSYDRVRYLEVFHLDKLEEMSNPTGVKGQLLERITEKRLGHCPAKVAKAHR
jgi:hypothetical protein